MDKVTSVKFSQFLALKRYSPKTIEIYANRVSKFQDFVGETPIERLDAQAIIIKSLDFVRCRNYGTSTHKQVMGALKLFYCHFLGVKISFAPVYPSRRQRFLPQILSKEEVAGIFSVTQNLKHKTILMTIYALGLRRSELIHLKISDIDGQRMLVHIKNAKGAKDRVVPLSQKLLAQLRKYYRAYKPHHFLFYGTNQQKYSESSLRNIFAKACNRANIKKQVTLHGLRHAYATHLLDSGVDIRIIQELLGHNNIKTTMRYTHVTNRSIQHLKSPLDFLEIEP